MTKSYAKSLQEYDEPTQLDAERILEAMKRHKDRKKRPTSIALDDKTIMELKRQAQRNDIPYQTLMRVLILEGLARLKRT